MTDPIVEFREEITAVDLEKPGRLTHSAEPGRSAERVFASGDPSHPRLFLQAGVYARKWMPSDKRGHDGNALG